jgi:hypothetical protein
MENFNPVLFNCVLLYLTVVLLSLLQSRFRIIKDDPWVFCFLVVLTPLVMLGKSAKLKTWTSITGFEIFGWTLVLSYFNPKRIVPRINEGYIFAYTLFHWYLLVDTISAKGLGFWLGLVLAISVYPTILIIKSALEHKKLSYQEKLTLYYWFLFAIIFTYIDQVSLDIIQPILALYEVNFATTTYVLITAVQLYFIATSFSLLFVGIPVFHLDRSGRSFKTRWAEAMRDWKETVTHKLGNFVEYQISFVQFFYITIISAGLFYLDNAYNFRLYLIFFYTVIFPIIFFYIKYTPDTNLEETNDNISS